MNTGKLRISFQSAIGVQTTHPNATIMRTNDIGFEKIPPLTKKEIAIGILYFIGRIFSTITGIAIVIGGIILAIVWMMPMLGDPINRLIVIVGFGYSGAMLIRILFMIIWG